MVMRSRTWEHSSKVHYGETAGGPGSGVKGHTTSEDKTTPKVNSKFLGPCDRLRQTKEGEEFWQNMMANKEIINEDEFLDNVNIKDALDEGETWEEYKDVAEKQGDSVKLFKAPNGVYFFQTAGFEFMWQGD